MHRRTFGWLFSHDNEILVYLNGSWFNPGFMEAKHGSNQMIRTRLLAAVLIVHRLSFAVMMVNTGKVHRIPLWQTQSKPGCVEQQSKYYCMCLLIGVMVVG